MIELLNNYQFLVPHFDPAASAVRNELALGGVDAVFVPFKERLQNIESLIDELSWYQGRVYLMPSGTQSRRPFGSSTKCHVAALHVEENECVRCFRQLLTTRRQSTNATLLSWDLPVKRNYALWYANRQGYKKVLLVDDDIRGITPFLFSAAIQALEVYKVCGCFIEDFPDTSLHGHLELLAGLPLAPFLSGSFLFINVPYIEAFFPHIYNEDWLFMIDHIRKGSICSLGTIRQTPYNPFADPSVVEFQELGETIAEGLYALLNAQAYHLRNEQHVWKSVLSRRRGSSQDLLKALRTSRHQHLALAILEQNKKITAHDCISFVLDWERDSQTWADFLRETNDG